MPRFLRVLRTLAAGLVLAATAPLALAAHWVCHLEDQGVDLVCLADADPRLPAADPEPARASVRGVAFPLDASLVYRVPMWTQPTDAAFVEQLAQATLCFRSPGCTASLAGSVWARLAQPQVVAVRSRRR